MPARFIWKKESKLKLPYADINKAYNEYKSKFKPQKEVKARHILVSSEAQAKDIIAQLKKAQNLMTWAKIF